MHFPPLRFRWFHGANGTSFVPCFEAFCRSLACNLAGWVVASNVWIPLSLFLVEFQEKISSVTVNDFCERVDFFPWRRRCFVKSIVEVLGPNHVLKPVLPQQAPMGSQEEQRMSSAEDQPDIQQIYIERLGKRRKLIITNMYALPYRSREVMRGAVFLCRCDCFNCSLYNYNYVCFRLVAENMFWQTYHQLQLKTCFWGGMILIVAWLYCLHFFYLHLLFIYIYLCIIQYIYVYIVMWYVCL